MFANGYRRIYHYHLMKCGGTTLNDWLDCQVSVARKWKRAWIHEPPVPRKREYALTGFYLGDAIHAHSPIRDFVPADAFCFTVLREPRARLVSQVSDWRREAENGNYPRGEAFDPAFPDALKLSLKAYLRKYGRKQRMKDLDNYLTRALAARDPMKNLWWEPDLDKILPLALENLRTSYHLVGLTERLSETRLAVAEAVGLAPDPEAGGHRNFSGSAHRFAAEIDAADKELAQFTRYDEIVYAEAVKMFEQRHAAVGAAYDEADFEKRRAEQALERLRPIYRDGDVVFEVTDPLIASGLHGRNRHVNSERRIWTGPGQRTVLYFPVPPGRSLEVKLWICGYAEPAYRDSLRIEIDDRPTPHVLQARSDSQDVLIAKADSTRPFVKLTLLVPDAKNSPRTEGHSNKPAERRGISFESYGWRFAA